jgi:phenolic acid decarboxylase
MNEFKIFLICVAILIINVYFTRWVFRINEIIRIQKEQIKLLKMIADKIQLNTNVTFEKQIINESKPTNLILDNNVNSEYQTTTINDEILVNLFNLIKSEQKSLFGGYSKKVAEELEKLCQTKSDTLNLMFNFKNKYNTELIDEISKLSNHINYLKRNLKIFIDFEIIENEYPFKIM